MISEARLQHLLSLVATKGHGWLGSGKLQNALEMCSWLQSLLHINSKQDQTMERIVRGRQNTPGCCQLRRSTASATSRQPQLPQNGPGLSVHAHKHKMGTEVHRHVGTRTHCPCAATQRRGSIWASIQCPDGLRSAWVTSSHPSSICRMRVPT